jgi:CDP-glucose 4,6-dehydratase
MTLDTAADASVPNAFAGKRVLVTGHTGFKGSWLCAWLLKLGARPYGYALEPPTDPSLFETVALARRMDHCIGDVRDYDRFSARLAEVDPAFVVHMAAQPLVRASYASPAETFDVNVTGTVNVLDAVRVRGKSTVVLVVTTDKCYDNSGQNASFCETDRLGGHDPYSASKAAAEIAVSAYRDSFFPAARFDEHGVAVASLRAGNVIGGGDWAEDRLVPDLIRAVTGSESPKVRNPDAVRPWQHVLDALSGYLSLGALMSAPGAAAFAGAWNFGPAPDDGRIPVSVLADRVLAAWGKDCWTDASEPDAPHEAPHLSLDCAKARAQLKWRPTWRTEEAVANTVAWYRANYENQDMVQYTDAQIDSYTDDARRLEQPWCGGSREAGR